MGCISFSRSAVPPGIKFLRRLRNKHFSFDSYRKSVLLLTFMAYALYHASRKPPSIVKDVLQSDSVSGSRNPFLFGYRSHENRPTFPGGRREALVHSQGSVPNSGALLPRSSLESPQTLQENFEESKGEEGTVHLKGWAPFNTSSGIALLGDVDVAFLASYAIGMYFAGHLGDRLCNRWFLTVGMIGSGACVSLFGMAYWWNIHWLGYFFIVQIIAGFFQATGWPSVVTVVARWFGKRKRGLVMGVWNAHTSVGNILGSLIGASMLTYGWGWAFIVPGISIAVGGFLIFLFLVVDPVIIGFPSPLEGSESSKHRKHLQNAEEPIADPDSQGTKSQPLLSSGQASETHEDAVGFFRAWLIPGVAPFAFCLFFTKLVAYTFLYWLPFYIRHTAIDGHYLSNSMSGNLSTIFDVGGVFGGILAGYFSDRLRARATTAASFMYLSIPALLLYNTLGSLSLWLNIILMFVVGMLVNGPYALITTAVSADLGTHKSLKGNSKALATVTAIIDGTGSVGAAVGPLLTGYISLTGWRSVFYMLMMSALVAGLLLSKLVIVEVRDMMARAKAASGET